MEVVLISDEENHNEVDFDMESDEENHGAHPDDEAIEVPAGDSSKGKPIKPKKVVRNPKPKLDALRLRGPRGIGILPNTFKSCKFKGKGHEKEDLNLLMKQLEHWSHRVFPKYTFDDMLKQLEKLGSKKPVQILIKKMRLDMLQSDELIVDNPDDLPDVVQTEDVFDQLLPNDRVISEDDNIILSTVTDNQSQLKAISTEDRERMERNKQLALEKRKAKLLERESLNYSQTSASQNDSAINSNTFSPLRDDEFDEDMLKAFDEECALKEPPSNICSSIEENVLKEKNSSADVLQLNDNMSVGDQFDTTSTPEPSKKLEQIDQVTESVIDIICTEDDVLDSL